MVHFKTSLNARERQVLEVILRGGPADLPGIRGSLPGPPSASLVSDVLGSLVRKGRVREESRGTTTLFEVAGEHAASPHKRVTILTSTASPARLARALLAATEPTSAGDMELMVTLARRLRARAEPESFAG